MRARTQPAAPPPAPPAGARTSLQEAADGAGVLRQERGPRHREQQLPGLHALPGHHAVAGHRALPAHRHLKGRSGSEQARAQPARVSAHPTHLGAQLQPHAPAPAQEAGHWVRVPVEAVATAFGPGHLRRQSALARPRPRELAGGGDGGAAARRGR